VDDGCMRADLSLAVATEADAAAIAELPAAVAHALTRLHGKGHWSSSGTEKGALRAIRTSRVILARTGAEIVGTLSLGTRKPSDAIRLDAYDGAVGAGAFYARYGFREMGRAAYKGTRLIYFELLLG
jgi:hypothetical protein